MARSNSAIAKPSGTSKGVDADPRHEGQLVVEEVSGRADLPFEPQPRAQHAGPGESAAIAELRKFEHDDREAFDVGAQALGRFIGFETDTQGRIARDQRVALLFEAGERNDGPVGRLRIFVAERDEMVFDETAVLDEPLPDHMWNAQPA